MDEEPKVKRGFATLSPERRREIATMGGKSIPSEKRSFSRSSDLAISAGRKGGLAIPREKRAFSQDRDLAVAAGIKGPHAAHKKADEPN